jgi:hypothetical protein
VPAPVRVTVLPTMVAGPLVTEYVTVPVDADVALTMNDGSPKVLVGIAVKDSVVVAGLTVKLVEAVAEVKLAVAAWLAPSTTVPAPVRVTVLPRMVAGPLVTE